MRVALAGLRFGAEFVPIYLHHPAVSQVTIVDPDPGVLQTIGDRFQVEKRATDLAQVLASREIDAVHLVTPIPFHAAQTLAVLEAGKHCACTVPMATSLADLHAIVELQRRSGLTYMMMETAVYTREFLLVRDLLARGEIGRIQLLRGSHYQDMENWPPYWMGLPPMLYATHAISPLLLLLARRARFVHCLGSGAMRQELQARYGNPFPAETAIFRFDGSDVAAEVTRTLFHTARAYTEAFAVYGEKTTFEWQQVEEESPVLFRMEPLAPGRGRPIKVERVEAPDRQDLLPEPIRRFTRRGVYDESNPHLSFLQGGGHGGSHPHLVHEFVSAIVDKRRPVVDAVTAANITAAGIGAHESATRNGESVEIPSFE
jgi:predicted dehydrogenase